MALLKSIGRRRPFRGGWQKMPLAAVLCALLQGGLWAAATPLPPAREYQVKAVFLFNFAQFVEWPEKAFPDPAAPLIIGVLGDDPFGPALDEAVRGETIRGRPLVTRRYRRVEEIDACHILFISRPEDARLERILAGLNRRSILTVSDAQGAAQRGVMIGFFSDSNRTRLRINVDAARAAGLVISSKLLRPAEIVANSAN